MRHIKEIFSHKDLSFIDENTTIFYKKKKHIYKIRQAGIIWN